MKPSLKRHEICFPFSFKHCARRARPFALDVLHLPSALAEPLLECWPVCRDNGVVVSWTALVRAGSRPPNPVIAALFPHAHHFCGGRPQHGSLLSVSMTTSHHTGAHRFELVDRESRLSVVALHQTAQK